MATDPNEDAARNADNSLRAAERDASNDRSFDAARYATRRGEAIAAIDALAQAAADHTNLAGLRKRVEEMDAKADKIQVDAFTQSIDSSIRGAKRDLDSLTSTRESRSPRDLDPHVTAGKQAEWADRVRPLVDAARPQLTSASGAAAIAAADAWLAAVETTKQQLAVLGDAFALFRAEVDVEGYGEIAFPTALDSVERNLDRDPERVVLAWDAVKKLLPSFQDARYAEIPEIKKILERHAGLAHRVDTELRPALAKLRIAPLIESATYTLDNLKRDTDNLDEDGVLRWRQELRAALLPLRRDWADHPDAEEFLYQCDRAFRRSEEDLGDKIVMREIQAAEVFVKPLVDRVERGLALKSAPRVKAYAPRLRARLATLTPFREHQRAQVLEARAEAALARIEEALGADAARDIAAAEAVPAFAIDVASDTKVQAVLTRLNAAFRGYREEYDQTQAKFEESVDLVNGGSSYGTADTIDSAARTMIRYARTAEEIGDELRKLDKAQPAVRETETAVSKLVKRAQAWKDRLTKQVEYAGVIGQARSRFEDADRARASADTGDPYDARSNWPDVLRHLGYCDEQVAAAVAILPDEHDEADAWGARSKALLEDATTKLRAACLAEASRLAQDNDTSGAEQYAEVLRTALPDAPENAQIAAVIAGTADARQKAQSEIAALGAKLEKRAEASAADVRATYDEWAAARQPITALAGSIVANPDAYRGKWIAGHARHLGRTLGDHFDELNGDTYYFEYEPAVRDGLFAGMKRLDDLYEQMANKVVAAADVAGVNTGTQHYPRDAHYLCEIVGTTSYTPQREVRDNYGRLLGTVDGNPYPVPKLVIRGVATTFFVIVPGHPPSLDALDVDGLVDG